MVFHKKLSWISKLPQLFSTIFGKFIVSAIELWKWYMINCRSVGMVYMTKLLWALVYSWIMWFFFLAVTQQTWYKHWEPQNKKSQGNPSWSRTSITMQIFCFSGVKIYVIGQSIGLLDSVITRLIQNKRCALGKWSGHFDMFTMKIWRKKRRRR